MSLFPLNVESYTVSFIYSVTKQEYRFASVCIGLYRFRGRYNDEYQYYLFEV